MIQVINKDRNKVYKIINCPEDIKCDRHQLQYAAVRVILDLNKRLDYLNFCHSCYVDLLENKDIVIDVDKY